MKKRTCYMAAALLAALALSCNKEQDVSAPLRDAAEEEGVFYVRMMDLTLDAQTGDPSTRTTIEKDGNGLKTRWLSADKIGILVPAGVETTIDAGTPVLRQGYMGFPLGQPALYDEGRTAVFSGTVPAYMKVTERSGRTTTTIITTVQGGPIKAFYPTMRAQSVSAVVSDGGTTTTTVPLLDLSRPISIDSQSGTLAGLADNAIMTATGELTINTFRQQGRLASPMAFKQEVAVLHIDHMWLGYGDEIDMSQGLTVTLHGAGIGKSVTFSSTTGQKTVTAGDIVINLTEDDVYEAEPEDWDDEKGRSVLPEGCGKVILWDTSVADMNGGTYSLEDVYIAFLPKSFQSGAELSLTAVGTGYGNDFQGEYLWNARTAYQAGKVYHLRDKEMQTYMMLPSGSTLTYYDDGYKPLDGAGFMTGETFWLYVESGGDVNQAAQFAYVSSSNENVARVEESKLICVGKGTAEITVKDKNGNTLSAQITVTRDSFGYSSYITADLDPEDIIFRGDKPAALVFAGETLQLQIKNQEEYLNPRHFTWSVADGSAVVSVDEKGLVTRLSSGEARIRAYDVNGDSRSIIVAAQEPNPSVVFCDEDGRELINHQFGEGSLVMSKTMEGKWYASPYLKPTGGGDMLSTASALNSVISYLIVEKLSDDRETVVDFGGLTYNNSSTVRLHNVFYSKGDEPALSRFKVTYNGPHGKVCLSDLYVLHDKITITASNLAFEQRCLSPAGGKVLIPLLATSSFFFPIEWEMISPSWSDYDPGQSPLMLYDAPWTTDSGTSFSVGAQIPMKKTGEIHAVTVVLRASTLGNRTGVSTNFALFPSIKNASFAVTPVKHDSVTEDIELADYVAWSSSNQVLSLGAGCGFVPDAYSSRTKVGAGLKLVYPGRNNGWLDLAISPLYTHISVSTSCDAGYYFTAYNLYHSDLYSEVVYAVHRPDSAVSGYLYITDGLDYQKTATVILYPDKVPGR